MRVAQQSGDIRALWRAFKKVFWPRFNHFSVPKVIT